MPVNVLRVLLIDARAVTKHFITDRHVIATTGVDVNCRRRWPSAKGAAPSASEAGLVRGARAAPPALEKKSKMTPLWSDLAVAGCPCAQGASHSCQAAHCEGS